MRILIIQTASIGDVILVTPMLEALHKHNPGMKLDLLVKDGMQQLFDEHPFVNNLIIWNKRKGKIRNLLKVILEVRRCRYDHVITVQRFFSSGFVTLLSGAAVKTGFDKNPFSFMFNHRIKHSIGDISLHEAGRNLMLLKPLGVTGDVKPKLYPSLKAFERTDSLEKNPWICIAPSSLWFTKQWPEELWVEFLDIVPADLTCYIIGSKDDVLLANRLCENTINRNTISLAGELTLLETASLMKGAVMNFTNDSAPLHLASAVDAPVTAIFCSTVPEFGFGPLSSVSFIAETETPLRCRPCGVHGLKACHEKHFHCAYFIRPSTLLSKISY